MTIRIREVQLRDLPEIAEMMHNALEPYYGGDHRAHARRIVESAIQGRDAKGHFSAAQIMYVAEDDAKLVGILNFVVKHQGTLKISPLIVSEQARGIGISRLLFAKMNEHATANHVRQIYCTVCASNAAALGYFLAHGFVRAGMAHNHYRPDLDEVMLYKIVEHPQAPLHEPIISIVPLVEADKNQVRALVLRRLAPYFEGVNDAWMDALFAGYDRKDSSDPNEKYKLIWVAKEHDKVVGLAAATPKKGEPIKLMPFVADTIEAFASLVVELPSLLQEKGHKLYTHCVPSSVEVEIFQRYGWQIEAMMPEAYKPTIVTQQWGRILGGSTMPKVLRVKRKYYDAIMAGTKPLEVRVGYNNIKKIKAGERIDLQCGHASGIVQVVDVRVYDTFADMLTHEDAAKIVPDSEHNVLQVLQTIYPPDKERLGVYVLELRVV